MTKKTSAGDSMGVKEQVGKIKDNWLLLLLVLILLVAAVGGADVVKNLSSSLGARSELVEPPMMNSVAGEVNYAGYALPVPGGTSDFAPGVQDRVVTKTASLSSEVKRGTFPAAEQQLIGIAAESKSILLSQNANQLGNGYDSYYMGNYQLKVPIDQYDTVVTQLKAIGTVKGFSASTQDITGQTLSLADQLATEKEKLANYQTMLNDATNLQDKLQITDKIYQEEQTVTWLEEQTNNTNERVEYATLSVTLTEEQSSFAQIQFAKLGDLARTLVSSLNILLYVVAFLLPWAALYGVYRLIRHLAGR